MKKILLVIAGMIVGYTQRKKVAVAATWAKAKAQKAADRAKK
jgi:hypothetical protein